MMEITLTITRALISYAAVALLVVLFWLVFGIVGMNVFGEADPRFPMGPRGHPFPHLAV